MKTRWLSVRVLSLLLVLALTGALTPAPARADAFLIDVPRPPGSGRFGESVTVLSNGNFVVTDPAYDMNKGAVYLYSPDRDRISQLTGEFPISGVGSGGIVVLANGNYVVRSPSWGTATGFSLGAVTWCSQLTGCSGTVSAANSLVGSTQGDAVGKDFWGGVTALANGNYVVRSSDWDNGSIVNAGAVTWGNGTSGTTGAVSAANSLVGGTADDQVGSDFNGGVVALTNGNYLVRDSGWDNGGVVDAGAITWGNGMGGATGVVSAANSLVGSSANDQVGGTGSCRVLELTNGNYVVSNSEWDLDGTHADVGAVTWGSGTTGVAGPISASNSLVGTGSGAPVGDRFLDDYGVTALTNGNYVVSSPFWTPDGSASHWGAVTWGSGTTGVAGPISAANSLVGSRFGDYVGSATIPLTNGNYVVSSPDWAFDGTHPHAGAVTWGNGSTGITGPVSPSNSLVGHALVGFGGSGVIALANGNYVVSTPAWYDEAQGPINIGAVTWGNGAIGTTGPVSVTNSLVGGSTYDSVGDGGLLALTNGNYVVISLSLGDGVGAITWADGTGVTTGVVSAANSLMGSTQDDRVGSGLWSSGVTALLNGNYVVSSPWWDNGTIVDAGAITWGNGAGGTTGPVSAANSLVGSTAEDHVGSLHYDGGVIALTNGNYVVSIPQWDNGSVVDAGAVAWGNGAGGTTGPVSAANSLVGGTAGDNVGDGSFFGAAGVTMLSTGDYLVNSPHWSSAAGVGAVTLGDGTSGTAGSVSASNSLVNASANDLVFGSSTLTLLSDGNASMRFPDWSNGSNHGAVSLIAGHPCVTGGPVSTANSVLGAATLGGDRMVSAYDAANAQLIVGRPLDNRVTILRCQAGPTYWSYLPVLIK